MQRISQAAVTMELDSLLKVKYPRVWKQLQKLRKQCRKFVYFVGVEETNSTWREGR